MKRLFDSVLDNFSPYVDEIESVGDADRSFRVTNANNDDFVAVMNAYVYSNGDVEFVWETNGDLTDRALRMDVPYWQRTKQLMNNKYLYDLVVNAIESEYDFGNDDYIYDSTHHRVRDNDLGRFGSVENFEDYGREIGEQIRLERMSRLERAAYNKREMGFGELTEDEIKFYSNPRTRRRVKDSEGSWDLWLYDVWGNEEDGWEVNNRIEVVRGLSIPDDETDESDYAILSALIQYGIVDSDTSLSDIGINYEEGWISINDATGKPLCEFENSDY